MKEIINGEGLNTGLSGNKLSFYLKFPSYYTMQESRNALCILIQNPDGAGGGNLPQDLKPEIDVSKYQTVIFHPAHHDKAFIPR